MYEGTCSKHCINKVNTGNLQGPQYFANYEQCSCTYLPFSIKDVLKSNFVSFSLRNVNDTLRWCPVDQMFFESEVSFRTLFECPQAQQSSENSIF